MADHAFSTKRLLSLRKLTRSVADLARAQLKEHLATLSYAFRPRTILGEFVAGPKDYQSGADLAFKELQSNYAALATARPFNLPRDLQPPLEVTSGVPEITSHEYTYEAKADGQSKTVTMTAPLKFVLSYSGFGPKRLRELLAGRAVGNETQEFVLHTLMLNLLLTRQTGLAKILDALRFPVTFSRLPGCGELNFPFLTCALPTLRPPDDVIIESTEISGMDAFEEIVDLEQLAALRDPFREKVMELAKTHGEIA